MSIDDHRLFLAALFGVIMCFVLACLLNYLAPGGACEVLFSPGMSVCLCVGVFVCVSGQYFGILFLNY